MSLSLIIYRMLRPQVQVSWVTTVQVRAMIWLQKSVMIHYLWSKRKKMKRRKSFLRIQFEWNNCSSCWKQIWERKEERTRKRKGEKKKRKAGTPLMKIKRTNIGMQTVELLKNQILQVQVKSQVISFFLLCGGKVNFSIRYDVYDLIFDLRW